MSLLFICVVIVGETKQEIEVRGAEVLLTEVKPNKRNIYLQAYLLLFVLCADCGSYDSLSSNMNLALAVLLLDRGCLIKVDYSLLRFCWFCLFL